MYLGEETSAVSLQNHACNMILVMMLSLIFCIIKNSYYCIKFVDFITKRLTSNTHQFA